MRPWTPGSWTLEIHGRGTDGEGASGYADRPAWLLASDLAVQGVGSLLSSPSSPGSGWGVIDERSEDASDAVITVVRGLALSRLRHDLAVGIGHAHGAVQVCAPLSI
nr:hypothetical protein [uncultured bacterium]